MEQGTCKLCGNFGDLEESHIIPEAFYKPLYDEKYHQFFRFEHAQRPKRFRKGLYESLLCPTCEDITGNYDDYAIKIWNGTETKAQYHPYTNMLVTTGVDYTKMKLFFVTTLWRMGVSTLPDFAHLSLGINHENKIRQMIRNNNPGKQHEYPILLFGARKDPCIREIMPGLITNFGPSRISGHRVYSFIIGSLMWLYFVSNHTNNTLQKEHCSLKEDGVLVVYQEDELIKNNILKSGGIFKQ
jgi:hypothetical protein